MRDTHLPIREAYHKALNGYLIIDNKIVPVYNDVPSKVEFPYVILSTQDSTSSNGTKSCDNTEDYILLDIVTGFKAGGGGKTADLIAAQILQIVPDITLEGIQKVSVIKVSDTTMPAEITPSHKIYRRLIRFRHFIHHFNN